MSLPSWERGLKLRLRYPLCTWFRVAPLVGARIEIAFTHLAIGYTPVAPLVGARIEIAFTLPAVYMVSCRSPRGSED